MPETVVVQHTPESEPVPVVPPEVPGEEAPGEDGEDEEESWGPMLMAVSESQTALLQEVRAMNQRAEVSSTLVQSLLEVNQNLTRQIQDGQGQVLQAIALLTPSQPPPAPEPPVTEETVTLVNPEEGKEAPSPEVGSKEESKPTEKPKPKRRLI